MRGIIVKIAIIALTNITMNVLVMKVVLAKALAISIQLSVLAKKN